MTGEPLTMLSPLDGRYRKDIEALQDFFPDFALAKYRLIVEIRFLLFLSQKKLIRSITQKEKIILEQTIETFSLKDAKRMRKIELHIKHDVKSVEYFLKEKLKKSTLVDLLPFIHFGLTSEDVNNLAYGQMLTDANKQVIIRELHFLLSDIYHLAFNHAADPMVARTHGQPAVPTTFGKEIAVYYSRIQKLSKRLDYFIFDGKLNGAVGNYNALALIFPKNDWIHLSREFVSLFGLKPNLVTTQLLPADSFIEYMQILYNINTILVGFCQDMWQYISRGLVTHKKDKSQVGSSTMPQKINPVDFEFVEGSMAIANSYIDMYVRKLPVSRLQRDLSDATIKRTIGSAFGHMIMGWKSLRKGLGKISFNKEEATREMNSHWEMLAEALQIVMKVRGDDKGFEKVKKVTMGNRMDKEMFDRLAKDFPDLHALTPTSYVGLAKKITLHALKNH